MTTLFAVYELARSLPDGVKAEEFPEATYRGTFNTSQEAKSYAKKERLRQFAVSEQTCVFFVQDRHGRPIGERFVDLSEAYARCIFASDPQADAGALVEGEAKKLEPSSAEMMEHPNLDLLIRKIGFLQDYISKGVDPSLLTLRLLETTAVIVSMNSWADRQTVADAVERYSEAVYSLDRIYDDLEKWYKRLHSQEHQTFWPREIE